MLIVITILTAIKSSEADVDAVADMRQSSDIILSANLGFNGKRCIIWSVICMCIKYIY